MSEAAALVLANALFAVAGAGLLPLVGATRTRRELIARLPVAWLTGIVAAELLGTACAAAGLRYGWPGLAATAALAAAGGLVRVSRSASGEPPRRPAPTRADVVAGTAALACLVLVAAEAVRALAVKPLVEYDGWAIWGMKARALAELGPRAGVLAGDAYRPAHLEYPLGLPSVVSVPLDLGGHATSTLVVAQTALVGAAGLLALWGLLHDRVRPAVLLPSLAAIATAPSLVDQLGTAYADVPLALVVAAGVVSIGRWVVEPRDAWLAQGALFLAGAAVTKSEGLLFALAALAATLLLAAGRRRRVAVAGAAVALAIVPWRLFVAVHDLDAIPDYTLSSSFDAGYVLGRAGRAPIAAGRLLEEAVDVREFGLLLVLSVLAAAAAYAFGARRLGLFSALFTLVSLAGLTWIYVISPLGLPDYLDSSAERVVSTVVVGGAALVPLLVAEALGGRERAEAS